MQEGNPAPVAVEGLTSDLDTVLSIRGVLRGSPVQGYSRDHAG